MVSTNSYRNWKNADLTDLVGQTLVSVKRDQDLGVGDNIEFTTESGRSYVLCHFRDCCEEVYIEDITGDLQDLVGVPILMAEESTSEDVVQYEWQHRNEWTFYKFATVKGYVTIRWCGGIVPYYSIEVSFSELCR